MGSTVGTTPTSSTPERPALVGEIDKNLKYKSIEAFNGERNRLHGFLLQLRLYIKFNGDRFRSETEQVLWAVTLLEGKALNWIEGFLEDYLVWSDKNGVINERKAEDTTIKIFGTWEGFVTEIKANFGVMDERKEAERAIEALRQKGSATAYTRDFQRYSTRTEWGDEALSYAYRKGLKDFVKDELLRYSGTTDTLETLIEAACKIDNDWYERNMEKKGKYDPNYKRMGEGRNRGNHSKGYGDPMELDATQRKELSPQQRNKHMQDRTCFNCGKPGHLARNCKGGGRRSQGYPSGKQLNATIQGRGGYNQEYNGPMMLNATWAQEDAAKEAGDQLDQLDQLGELTRAAEALDIGEKATKTHKKEESSDSEDSDEVSISDGSEMSPEDYLMYTISAGEKLVWTAHQEAESIFEQELAEVKERLPAQEEVEESIQYWKAVKDVFAEHMMRIHTITSGYNHGRSETNDAVRRSQQYQEAFTQNVEYMPELRMRLKVCREMRKECEGEIRKLQGERDVTAIDHPRHAELAWSSCWNHSCIVHYSSKIDADYWPRRQGPVFFDDDKPVISLGELPTAPEPSKN